MASKYEMWVSLTSDKMKPFWADVKRIRETQMKALMDGEDVSYIKAVKALDRILELPSQYESSFNKNG